MFGTTMNEWMNDRYLWPTIRDVQIIRMWEFGWPWKYFINKGAIFINVFFSFYIHIHISWNTDTHTRVNESGSGQSLYGQMTNTHIVPVLCVVGLCDKMKKKWPMIIICVMGDIV